MSPASHPVGFRRIREEVAEAEDHQGSAMTKSMEKQQQYMVAVCDILGFSEHLQKNRSGTLSISHSAG
jgi:hypothetical protein